MPDEGPTTATFLFTDIEGSTELLRSHRDDYAAILADHHRILREHFAAYGGREVDNQGDSFFVAFTRAKDAVLAAAACQRALAGHRWEGGATVRVRMGIHTGEAELSVDRYVGLSVHRAARIGAAGHGGQVLVSPTTAGLLEDEEVLPGLTLEDLGTHWLKDIPRPVRLYQLDIEGLPTTFPPVAEAKPPGGDRRKRRAALAAIALLLAGVGVSAAFLANRGEAAPKVVPNSLVRIDPHSLRPTKVIPVGDAPDLVVAAGGYVWVTHYILRDSKSASIHNGGDRTLERVDPRTGDVKPVGGGLAPCGLTADPSGDLWVANCFKSGQNSTVTRVDATTLVFKRTVKVPSSGDHFYRGLAYGGGSLWVAGGSANPNSVIQIDPRARSQKTIQLQRAAIGLMWADGYGDLWITNFEQGSLTSLHPATGAGQFVPAHGTNPVFPVLDRDTIWVGDWSSPQLLRFPAVGSSVPTRIKRIKLPVRPPYSDVWNVAAGAGSIWATTPRAHALWQIDPQTNHRTRIPMPYLPSGVTADADDVWVTVRE